MKKTLLLFMTTLSMNLMAMDLKVTFPYSFNGTGPKSIQAKYEKPDGYIKLSEAAWVYENLEFKVFLVFGGEVFARSNDGQSIIKLDLLNKKVTIGDSFGEDIVSLGKHINGTIN